MMSSIMVTGVSDFDDSFRFVSISGALCRRRPDSKWPAAWAPNFGGPIWRSSQPARAQVETEMEERIGGFLSHGGTHSSHLINFHRVFPTHHSLGVPPLMETHNYAENRFLNLILVSLCFSQFLDGRFNVVAPGIGASSFATFPVDHPPVAIGICPSESKLGTWWANMQVCPLILLMLGRGRSPVWPSHFFILTSADGLGIFHTVLRLGWDYGPAGCWDMLSFDIILQVKKSNQHWARVAASAHEDTWSIFCFLPPTPGRSMSKVDRGCYEFG